LLRLHLHRPVIIAVIAVRMMQVTADQIVDVIAVRHLFMATILAVHMSLDVLATRMLGRAGGGIGLRHIEGVFIDMIAMHMVQMTIVEIVGVALVLDGGVPAVTAVLMGVPIVFGAVLHRIGLPSGKSCSFNPVVILPLLVGFLSAK
jgi:hypothetical protein